MAAWPGDDPGCHPVGRIGPAERLGRGEGARDTGEIDPGGESLGEPGGGSTSGRERMCLGAAPEVAASRELPASPHLLRHVVREPGVDLRQQLLDELREDELGANRDLRGVVQRRAGTATSLADSETNSS